MRQTCWAAPPDRCRCHDGGPFYVRMSPKLSPIARLARLIFNNRNDGPPDLDELWRDFNRKLSGLFGGKGGPQRGGSGGGDDRGPQFQPDMKSAGIGIGLIAGVVALVWLGSGFFIVQEGQQAVVTTFGKYSHTTDAGFQWRFPYPIQAHETVVRHAAAVGGGGPQHRGAGHRAARQLDAHAGREHRRHSLHGAVPPCRCTGPTCSRTGRRTKPC